LFPVREWDLTLRSIVTVISHHFCRTVNNDHDCCINTRDVLWRVAGDMHCSPGNAVQIMSRHLASRTRSQLQKAGRRMGVMIRRVEIQPRATTIQHRVGCRCAVSAAAGSRSDPCDLERAGMRNHKKRRRKWCAGPEKRGDADFTTVSPYCRRVAAALFYSSCDKVSGVLPGREGQSAENVPVIGIVQWANWGQQEDGVFRYCHQKCLEHRCAQGQAPQRS